MDPLVLLQPAPTIYNTYCSFAGSQVASLDANQWIEITTTVLMLNFALAAILYAFSNFFPTRYREQLRGAVKYEAFQGFISLFIFIILIATSLGLCNVGQLLVYSSTVQGYQNPIQYSQNYVSNLMFNTGTQLFVQTYQESVLLTVDGNLASSLEELLPEFGPVSFLDFDLGNQLLGVMFGYSGALTGTFMALVAVTFGVLFVIYMILVFVQQLAFTIVLPLSLIMRSIPFAGPNLRQTADTFLALAVGFYLIFPLTILMDNFIVTWIFVACPSAGLVTALCNPYQQYLGNYQLSNIQVSNLFNININNIDGNGILGGTSLPNTFYNSANGGGANGIPIIGPMFSGFTSALATLFTVPQKIILFSFSTAQYLFQGIFLIGLDLAITTGFAIGLSKGLSAAGRMLGVGPFWGNY